MQHSRSSQHHPRKNVSHNREEIQETCNSKNETEIKNKKKIQELKEEEEAVKLLKEMGIDLNQTKNSSPKSSTPKKNPLNFKPPPQLPPKPETKPTIESNLITESQINQIDELITESQINQIDDLEFQQDLSEIEKMLLEDEMNRVKSKVGDKISPSALSSHSLEERIQQLQEKEKELIQKETELTNLLNPSDIQFGREVGKGHFGIYIKF